MFDARARRALQAPLDRAAAALDRPGITPDRLTVLGLVLGVASAVTAGLALWWVALVLWLLSRLADGLDGPLARRRRRAHPAAGGGEAGGFLDICADFVVYGAGVVGVAVGAAGAHGAPWWPFLLVLLAYYVNGTAFLAFSSIAERTGRQIDDGRSLSFLGGLAEGTETILVHSLWLLLPGSAWQVALVWAGVVAVTAVHRVLVGYRALRA
ncbi:phosphatidylglycerophosphate synthase [Kineococcus xinjiangensis]|uniref:Phosphatidylglycerophosphate synthase n=1 Tax=Kineococcus xinjiangensis TaxID=512762 RepID=A0A2S6IVD3_9ACTN|nr:CDP-alcohol phosphatidyltransferase family protein [Kineococcus xinjiangensis]PPK98149.1 phosphatidylglycerophosphate synthase [Kineococcus xinjiangensis]